MAPRRVLVWANTSTPPAFLPQSWPWRAAPEGATLPHGVTGALQQGPVPFPAKGSRGQSWDPWQPGGSTSTGLTVIDPHCGMETAVTAAPSPAPLPPCSSSTTEHCSRNTAGKAASIHSPEAPLASPSPAKHMPACTQIIFNLYFNVACKCTAER